MKKNTIAYFNNLLKLLARTLELITFLRHCVQAV